ncbi:hypothetical protein M404DRAFT_25950 [Pisolithus tinctorius Marx 270]|uniref:Uncharacterized protein n=1 Tax=Pisolithus tinctorius Marx 270 TaxID=870435 RepID=A0A0C3PAF6_PISTI|nr:hypothetical protein M404DRAFT_25950 [Pisolithus tinctorius Marx 270]
MDFGDIKCQHLLAKSTDYDPKVSVNFIQTQGPTIQDDDDKPEDDLPDLESVSDDDEYSTNNKVTTDNEDSDDGMRIALGNYYQGYATQEMTQIPYTPIWTLTSSFMI